MGVPPCPDLGCGVLPPPPHPELRWGYGWGYPPVLTWDGGTPHVLTWDWVPPPPGVDRDTHARVKTLPSLVLRHLDIWANFHLASVTSKQCRLRYCSLSVADPRPKFSRFHMFFLLPPASEGWREVMFSQACVCSTWSGGALIRSNGGGYPHPV